MTIIDLELQAICDALGKVVEGNFPHRNSDIVILSDSSNALYNIHSSYTSYSNRNLTTQLIHNRLESLIFENQDRKIFFQKVPAHKGIPGNELADHF